MSQSASLKLFLKRGALVTAANWPLVLIQFVADALVKTLLVVPIVGGVVLVVLLVGGDPKDLLQLEPREVLPALTGVLAAQPLALAAFLGAFGLVVAGGSVFMFVVKGGTVAVLAAGEAAAGNIEHRALRIAHLQAAGRFSIERFTDGSHRLFQRYLTLGGWLGVGYAASAAAYLTLVFAPPLPGMDGPLVIGLASIGLIAWITLVNFVYLLSQIIVATDDCAAHEAVGRVVRLLTVQTRPLAEVLGAILLLMVLATAASILAVAALGFIAFVPFVGLAALPLQVVAWLIRGMVFQFISLTGVAAYLRIYLAADVAPHSARVTVA